MAAVGAGAFSLLLKQQRAASRVASRSFAALCAVFNIQLASHTVPTRQQGTCAEHCLYLLPRSLKLQAIHRFTSTATAVEDMTSIGEGKVSKGLKKFLTDEITGNKKLKNEKLAVSEPKLGSFASDPVLRSRCRTVD